MHLRRKFIFIAFTIAITAIVILPLENCNQSNKTPYHNFLHTEEFQKLPREKQIQKCATCHKQEFENEKNGPHAFSYTSILEHKNFVNSDKYDCDFYTKHVNRSYKDCLGCHTPQNLYETMLHDSLNQPASFVENLLKISHPHPLKRDQNSASTGIDCMSCHYDGKEMVSLKHIFSADDSIPSKQTLEKITLNNLNCYLCHFDAVRTFNPEIAIKRTGTALCVNCHQEYDAKGVGTHYFYWQHDAEGKHNPKPGKLMDDFHFTVSNDQKEGIITWQNTIMSHKISPGPEMILFCEVLSKDSAVLGSKTIRINKKKEFDAEMYKTLGNKTQLGTEGDDVPLDGKPIEYRLPLKNGNKAAIFKISFMHKSQYWFPDSLGTRGIVKLYPIQ
jgi:hypothetical protein